MMMIPSGLTEPDLKELREMPKTIDVKSTQCAASEKKAATCVVT